MGLRLSGTGSDAHSTDRVARYGADASDAALHPPPSARTRSTLAASRRAVIASAVRSLLSAFACSTTTAR